MYVGKMGGSSPEASAPCTDCFTGRARGRGVWETGPCHWAIGVDLRLGKVARVIWLFIFIAGVDVSALYGVVGTDDDVGNGLWISRRNAKADGVPVEDLV